MARKRLVRLTYGCNIPLASGSSLPIRRWSQRRRLNMRKSALLRAAVVFAAALWALPASAQELRGSIEGTVHDSSGGVLPGVTVLAKNLATNAVQTAVSE